MSLVEIAVVIAILAILTSQAAPTFAGWLRNSQIRTATESLQNGLQLARAEAIRRNRSVVFTLTDAPGSSWSVGCANPIDNGVAGVEDAGDCPATIQARTAAGDATDRPQIAALPDGARVVTFDSIGRVTGNLDGSASLNRIDSGDPTMDPALVRALRVTVGVAGEVRMCDPAAPAGDPRRCL